jgi:hypothetical protein
VIDATWSVAQATVSEAYVLVEQWFATAATLLAEDAIEVVAIVRIRGMGDDRHQSYST